MDGDHRMIRTGYTNEKKFGLGKYSFKIYENRLLHMNYVVFAIIFWFRKNMIKNGVDVYLGKEALNIDRLKFETFDDTLAQLKNAIKLAKNEVKNLNHCEGVKQDLSGINHLSRTGNKEPYYLAIASDGKNFKDDRSRLNIDVFISSRLSKIGYRSSNTHKIGLTGTRKHYTNDVNNASIEVNSSHLLDCFLSNTAETRLNHYQNTFATREEYGANIFATGVDPESVKHFNEKKNIKSMFDYHEMYDKTRQPVDLTPLCDPIDFIIKQTSETFQMKACPFCSKEYKYMQMLFDHVQKCDKTTLTAQQRRLQVNKMHVRRTGNQQCKVCTYCVRFKNKMNDHYEIYHPFFNYDYNPAAIYECPKEHCRHVYTMKKNLNKHLKACNKTYESKLKSMKQCDKCKAIYFSEYRYNQHVKICDGSGNCVPKGHEFRADNVPDDEGGVCVPCDELNKSNANNPPASMPVRDVASLPEPQVHESSSLMDGNDTSFCPLFDVRDGEVIWNDLLASVAEGESDEDDEDKKIAAV